MQEERVFNRGVIEQIRERCFNYTMILSQAEVDEIIKAGLVGDETALDLEALIERLRHPANMNDNAAAPPDNPESPVKLHEQTIALLNKIAQGQDEIKKLLVKMSEK
jgi:hypothetical protein